MGHYDMNRYDGGDMLFACALTGVASMIVTGFTVIIFTIGEVGERDQEIRKQRAEWARAWCEGGLYTWAEGLEPGPYTISCLKTEER